MSEAVTLNSYFSTLPAASFTSTLKLCVMDASGVYSLSPIPFVPSTGGVMNGTLQIKVSNDVPLLIRYSDGTSGQAKGMHFYDKNTRIGAVGVYVSTTDGVATTIYGAFMGVGTAPYSNGLVVNETSMRFRGKSFWHHDSDLASSGIEAIMLRDSAGIYFNRAALTDILNRLSNLESGGVNCFTLSGMPEKGGRHDGSDEIKRSAAGKFNIGSVVAGSECFRGIIENRTPVPFHCKGEHNGYERCGYLRDISAERQCGKRPNCADPGFYPDLSQMGFESWDRDSFLLSGYAHLLPIPQGRYMATLGDAFAAESVAGKEVAA